ncbi:MAG: FHA domain-containing protein [Bryobacteraceae bacterium]
MTKTTFTIGRDPGADIPVADGSVSRIHAEVTLLDSDRIFLIDCQSSNGTFAVRNGVESPIHQEQLNPGDSVKFGGVTIAVADIVAAIRRKMGASAPRMAEPAPPPVPAAQGKAPKPKRFDTEAKLIRCGCGDIKAVGSPCPACGH